MSEDDTSSKLSLGEKRETCSARVRHDSYFVMAVVRFSWYVGEFESCEVERSFRNRSADKNRARIVLGSSSDMLRWRRS